MRIGRAAGLTDTGRRRRQNEDAFVCDPPLFAIADGMGGAQAGEVASELAANAVQGRGDEPGTGETRVVELIQDANRRVFERAHEDASFAGMGTTLTLALVENLQRADLNPIEEAEGYQRLIAEFSLTQQQVAEVIGKDRSTIANMLRLLGLPASVRRMVQDAQLTLGHARALLALGDERQIVELAREVVTKNLTVRDVEHRARTNRPDHPKSRHAQPAPTSGHKAEARRTEDLLRQHFQTDVKLVADAKNRGSIRIAFYSLDDLERVLDLMLGHKRDQQ